MTQWKSGTLPAPPSQLRRATATWALRRNSQSDMTSFAISTIAEAIVLYLRLIVANSRGRRCHTRHRKEGRNGHKYTVEEIGHWEAKNFLSAHHYLSQLGNGFIAIVSLGLYNEKNQLVGVQNWNHISAPETLVGAFGLSRDTDQSRFLELTRLSMDDEKKEKNLTSWFVARGIRYVRRKYRPRAIISYADSKYHCGYIYQATNWGYYGLTAPKKDFVVNGKIQQRGLVKGKDGHWVDRPRKHRYMIVFDKSLVIKWIREPYPKQENHEMKLIIPDGYQPSLFDYTQEVRT